MSKKRDIHVVPHPHGGWATKREGADRAGSRHGTQGDAIETARETARRERLEVVIHRPDGTIRDSDSYGNDPVRSRDTKH
jgi:type IV secretory pathway TrbL component